MQRILILGTGNLGKRHLQALSNLSLPFEVFCYDAIEGARNSVIDFCTENKIVINNLTILDTYNNALDVIDKESIVIVVTTARGRGKLLEEVILKTPKAIIAEKPVCQTHDEFIRVKELSELHKVPVYVNYIAHMQPFYHKIQEEIQASEGYVFYSNMPQWGIGCVGIHHFELLTWLFGVTEYTITNKKDYSSVYEQKRKGFQDIAGTVVLRVNNNNLCVINNTEFDSIASIQIITEKKIYTIYEQQKVMTIIDKSLSGKVEVVQLKYTHVSQYTHLLIEAISNGEMEGNKVLPNIQASYLSHKMLFDYLELMHAKEINIT